MSLMSLLMGTAVVVVGVEDIDENSVRVYVGSRGDWRYFVAEGADADECRRGWRMTTGHVLIDRDQVGELHVDEAGREKARAEWKAAHPL